jgi:hypothetical protein
MIVKKLKKNKLSPTLTQETRRLPEYALLTPSAPPEPCQYMPVLHSIHASKNVKMFVYELNWVLWAGKMVELRKKKHNQYLKIVKKTHQLLHDTRIFPKASDCVRLCVFFSFFCSISEIVRLKSIDITRGGDSRY